VRSKARTAYRCTECGAEHPKWSGRCDICGEWNTLVEEIVAARPATAAGRARAARPSLASNGSAVAATRLGDLRASDTPRWTTGIDEFDFVLGGGIVPGSMVLIGGEPGIGKSTLLAMLARQAACDVVVLPSTWEGFGNPSLESVTHRRPLVIARYPVAEELAAFGFEWFPPDAMAKLDDWLTNPDPDLLERNLAVARAHFSLDDLADRIGAVLPPL